MVHVASVNQVYCICVHGGKAIFIAYELELSYQVQLIRHKNYIHSSPLKPWSKVNQCNNQAVLYIPHHYVALDRIRC